MTASSYFYQHKSTGQAPWHGRLHMTVPSGKNSHAAAWLANSQTVGEYLQIDLGTTMKITGVATQGRPTNWQQWITEFTLKYSTDNITWKSYEDPYVKVIDGSTREVHN
jgi:hypothetical protein